MFGIMAYLLIIQLEDIESLILEAHNESFSTSTVFKRNICFLDQVKVYYVALTCFNLSY